MDNFLTKKKLRDFGIIIGIFFPIFFGYLLPLLFGHEYRVWTIYLGIIFLTLAIISPKLLKLPYKVWIKIGYILGWINSRIILGLIYFFVLLPISIIMKFFKYDPLRVKNINQESFRELKKDTEINLDKIF
tara:strand:- start:5 stop:397 length:393 start_codon:yes stop_codon:yes gene_type:complete